MKRNILLIHWPCRSRRWRSGFTAFEALAAVAVLVVLLALAGQMSGTMLKQRRFVQRHRAAMDAQTNLMHIAMALPYAEVNAARLRSIAAEFTPKRGRWEITVDPYSPSQAREEATEPPEAAGASPENLPPDVAKRIVIALDFEDGRSGAAAMRPLVAWRYPAESPAAVPAREPTGHGTNETE